MLILNIKETLKLIRSKFIRQNIDKIFALLPISVFGLILFGINALLIYAVSISSTVIFDYLLNTYITNNDDFDYLESVAGGLFLAIMLPPTLPLYVVVIGALFSVFVVRLFLKVDGGFLLPPVIVSRIFLQLSFPTQMSTYLEPMSDVIATATPLSQGYYNIKEIILGVTSGCIGETSSILIIIGGLYLLTVKLISWEIPVSIFASSLIISIVMGENPLTYICSGSLLISCFYFNLDSGIIPGKRLGKVIFGVGCGLIIAFIRYTSIYPDGSAFAIVIMSLFVNLIDKIKIREKRGLNEK